MADYSSGKIYKLYVRGFENSCYIGSTIETLNMRFRKHKYNSKRVDKYQYASSSLFENDNDVVCELLENYPCESKQELLIRERYWLEQFPDAINKNPPILEMEERVEHQKGAVERYAKTEKGQATRAKCKKNWDEANKEYVAEYDKAYKDSHKEQSALAHKKWAEANKEKIKANKNIIITCSVCGEETTKGNKWRHDKKHT